MHFCIYAKLYLTLILSLYNVFVNFVSVFSGLKEVRSVPLLILEGVLVKTGVMCFLTCYRIHSKTIWARSFLCEKVFDNKFYLPNKYGLFTF